jgi:lipopolysaccharide export system permease protein
MVKLIDRLLIFGYVKAYLVCLSSLLSLYIVVDLFTNLDDFAQHSSGLGSTLRHIGTYYGYRIAHIFDRLCEAIVLLAAMFTVAWMQRSNELLPLLSAGVSTRRIVRPVLFSACAMLGLTVINQELIIPRIAHQLLNDREDLHGDRDIPAQGAFEPNSIHIHGNLASRKEKLVREFYVNIPETVTNGNIINLHAQEARYVPPGPETYSGGWLLTKTQPAELENWNQPDLLKMIDPGKYFLYTQEVDFDAVTRKQDWYIFASTLRLQEELNKPDSKRLADMAVLFHMRLTRPILGMILVFMGLSVILRDQNRHVFISVGLCLVICAVFFGACFACKFLGNSGNLSPALAAWLPVMFFGPLSFVMFDAVHT